MWRIFPAARRWARVSTASSSSTRGSSAWSWYLLPHILPSLRKRYPKLTDWVEAEIGETLNFYRLPRQHHKHLKSTNMLERLNEEIKRRTRVVRIFPNAASCLRLVRALCAETHEGWLEDHRYLNMEYLKEQKKEQVRSAA